MNKRGQALIYSLVSLPVLILLSSFIYKASATALHHNQVQASLDQKVLKILNIQAQGLQALGQINPLAKSTIDARRLVDEALAAQAVTPVATPHLLKLRQKLLNVQKIIAQKQDLIKTMALNAVTKESKNLVGQTYKFKVVTEKFPQTLQLYVKDAPNYEGEVGAPLELTDDFNKKQNILIKVQMKTENFLYQIKNINHFENIKLQSFAQIEMKSLEAPWEVRLREP